jgi:hypothetical protein
MGAPGSDFPREGRLAWAGIGILFASLLAIGIAAQVPNLETCQQCGVTLTGTLCDPTSPGGCGSLLALVASLVVGLTGFCVLAAVHASAAYRARRGAMITSFLAPGGSIRGVFLQITSVVFVVEGAQLLGVGLMAPLFQSCHEGCPVPYSISGLQWVFVGSGVLLLLLGATGFMATRRSGLGRTEPTRPISAP